MTAMWLKLAGSILVFLACVLFCNEQAQGYLQREEEIKQLLSAVRILATEMSYSATFLAEALKKAALNCRGEVALLFLSSAELLDSPTPHTAGECWQIALEEWQEELALLPSDLAVLGELGALLGETDSLHQTKRLQVVELQLTEQLSYAAQAREKNVKLWRYLGLAGGIALVLIIW